jgi:DegV family protein with EDD domain
MVRIISDTSTLYSSAQAKESGFSVAPLSVTIGGNSYREFDEISSDAFVALIQQGNMPTSSQPAVGEVCALYEQYPDDEILNISMADGLSGTYASAVAASELCENKNITVLNSRTLCGPHRYLVERAVELAAQNRTLSEIVEHMHQLMDTGKSYLIPADFGYLRRGGRLSPLVSYVGQAAKLSPVLTQTEDGRKLTIATVRRSFSQAIQHVGKALQTHGVGDDWRIYITHAAAPQLATQAREILKKIFPSALFEIHPLSPAFITQGGPSCVAVQVIRNSIDR